MVEGIYVQAFRKRESWGRITVLLDARTSIVLSMEKESWAPCGNCNYLTPWDLSSLSTKSSPMLSMTLGVEGEDGPSCNSWSPSLMCMNIIFNMCNTRFIKGHKPSNHIRARIKSHVYTTEWTIYHSTYHVKDIIKRIRMLFITLMTKCLIQSMRKRKTYTRSSQKQGGTGMSTGRWTPRSPPTPGSSGWTPSRP